MLLAIDAGNTNVVFAVHDGREWRGRWRIATRDDRTSDEYAVWLLALFRHAGLNPSAIDRCAIGTVVPAALYNLRRLFANKGAEFMDADKLFTGEQPPGSRWPRISSALADP